MRNSPGTPGPRARLDGAWLQERVDARHRVSAEEGQKNARRFTRLPPSSLPICCRIDCGPDIRRSSLGRKMSNEPLEREPIDRMRARLEALLKANAAPRCGARSKQIGRAHV